MLSVQIRGFVSIPGRFLYIVCLSNALGCYVLALNFCLISAKIMQYYQPNCCQSGNPTHGPFLLDVSPKNNHFECQLASSAGELNIASRNTEHCHTIPPRGSVTGNQGKMDRGPIGNPVDGTNRARGRPRSLFCQKRDSLLSRGDGH